MSFISYAQNFEDVMLWRALKHIESGFYIDVGANDPTIDSVTRVFYERGWHGINIEPLPSHHKDLLNDRPRDINLQCAAGNSSGEIEVWECNVRGWATASVDVLIQHREGGHEGTFHKVPVKTLAEICANNVIDDIHFLKIDVEGFEKEVIGGMDFSRFRPWILVIEATKPNSTEEVYDEWESDVLAADYSLAYCDGVNRFYVAKERPELLDSLRYPPNIFDGFIRMEQLIYELRAQEAEAKVEQAEAKAEQAEAKAEQAEAKAEQAEAKAYQFETALTQVYASTSWRVTVPLRKAGRARNALLQLNSTIKSGLKSKIKLLLTHARLYVTRRPKLKYSLLRVFDKFPYLKIRLIALSGNNTSEPALLVKYVPLELANLTPNAREIYHDLKLAFENKNKEAQ